MNPPHQSLSHPHSAAAPPAAGNQSPAPTGSVPATPIKKKRRALYRAGRRSVSPAARDAVGDDSE